MLNFLPSVTVTGTGFLPGTAGETTGTRPPLAGKFTGERGAPQDADAIAAREAATDHGLTEEAGAAGDEDEGRIHRVRRLVHSFDKRRRWILALWRTSTGRARWKTTCLMRPA